MKLNNIHIIIRSHECVMSGVENLSNTNLYTVFSCSDYGGKYKNKGAILMVMKNWKQIQAKQIEFIPGATQWAGPSETPGTSQGRQQQYGPGFRNQGSNYRPVTPPRQYLLYNKYEPQK